MLLLLKVLLAVLVTLFSFVVMNLSCQNISLYVSQKSLDNIGKMHVMQYYWCLFQITKICILVFSVFSRIQISWTPCGLLHKPTKISRLLHMLRRRRRHSIKISGGIVVFWVGHVHSRVVSLARGTWQRVTDLARSTRHNSRFYSRFFSFLSIVR